MEKVLVVKSFKHESGQMNEGDRVFLTKEEAERREATGFVVRLFNKPLSSPNDRSKKAEVLR